MRAIRIKITGKVQGVFFRAETKSKATERANWNTIVLFSATEHSNQSFAQFALH
jgi:hypothetical protein